MTGMKIGGYIITEASLSLLGLGAQASDGNMGIHDKREQGLYNFGSLDCFCPRLYDRPDVALFQYTRGQLKR